MKPVLSLLVFCLLGYATDTNTTATVETKVEQKLLKKQYCETNQLGKQICMTYELGYPVITDTKNSTLKENVDRIVQKYIAQYRQNEAQKEVNEVLDEWEMDYNLYENVLIDLFSTTNKTFTLAVQEASFSGGAHPNYNTSYENYDIATDQNISLGDLFIENSEETLKRSAEAYFRKINNLMPHESLKNVQWMEDQFQLASNVAITPQGLQFLYNPYEIKAYVFGETEFLLPYDQISTIIKPDGYLSKIATSTTSAPTPATPNKQIYENSNGKLIVTSKVKERTIDLTVVMENLSKNQKEGWLSISFPQLSGQEVIKRIRSKGFNTVQSYAQGSDIYNAKLDKVAPSEYLLVEGGSNKWRPHTSKSIHLSLKLPEGMKEFYINVRGTIKGKDIYPILLPEIGVEDQQGFYSYRTHIDVP